MGFYVLYKLENVQNISYRSLQFSLLIVYVERESSVRKHSPLLLFQMGYQIPYVIEECRSVWPEKHLSHLEIMCFPTLL